MHQPVPHPKNPLPNTAALRRVAHLNHELAPSAAADCIWCGGHSIAFIEFQAVFPNTLMQYWKKRSGISEMKVHTENATTTSSLQWCLQLRGCVRSSHSLKVTVMWTAQHRNKPNNIPSSMEQTCSSISTAPLHSAGCQTLSHWPLLAHKPCCCLLLTGCDV